MSVRNTHRNRRQRNILANLTTLATRHYLRPARQDEVQSGSLRGLRSLYNLEGERAKLGTNYCVVDGTGGNGASKGYSGQGNVLMGNTTSFRGKEYVNSGFNYETRRRNGDFDPNKADGK